MATDAPFDQQCVERRGVMIPYTDDDYDILVCGCCGIKEWRILVHDDRACPQLHPRSCSGTMEELVSAID